MTPGVITCTACGRQARAGSRFCPSCATPFVAPWAAEPVAGDAPNAASAFAFTNAWDAVLPRIQEALFGEFVISQELGRGGMAAVFLAHQLRLNRKVAIKVMAPTLMSELGLVDRFRDEATTVARLDHPNIISIYEVGETDGLQYFVMQYVTGRSLERAMRQFGRLPFELVRGILFDVGNALAYAHRHQVIHRDVKPGNILLSLDGRVFVSDFGIAKVAAATARTQTGAVIGTPAYMSPEQCMGRPLTWSADQYSLGVVAYELVTGVLPFSGSSFTVMRGHMEELPPPILARRPDCPPDVAAAIERMLAKNVADRFASMAGALAALGATRARITDTVEAAIGELAVPLPDETGVMIVHTPASPAPLPTPLRVAIDPPPAAAALQETGLVQAKAPPRDAAPPPASNRMAALATRFRSAALWLGNALRRARAATAPLAQRARAGVVTGLGSLRFSRRTLGLAGATMVMVATGVALVRLTGASRSTTAQPPPVIVPESALGSTAVPKDSAKEPVPSVRTDSLSDSLMADAFVPRDSSDASVVTVGRQSTTVPPDGALKLIATVKDFRGNRIRQPDLRWTVGDERVATVDSLSGWVRGRIPGRRTWVVARAGYGADSILITVEKPPAGRAVATVPDADPEPARQAEPPATKFDAVLEATAVQHRFALLLDRAIAAKDTSYVRAYYWKSTDQDFAARDALIKLLLRPEPLVVAPPQNPPEPTFTGTNLASVTARITLKWLKGKRNSDDQSYTIESQFRRDGSAWSVRRFRLTPTK